MSKRHVWASRPDTSSVKVPMRWRAWHGDGVLELSFPDRWVVTAARMPDAVGIAPAAIDHSLANPLATPPLSDMASRARSAAIAVEDITRPTPTAPILRRVLRQLERGGIDRSHMRVIVATGAHTTMTRAELVKKLGREVLETVEVVQHSPYENLEQLGTTTRGTPIWISQRFMEMDLRVGIGSITPHSYAGFGGGAKIVAIGLAGMETIHANHSRAAAGEAGPMGCVDDNACRSDMEEIARKAGLSFVVNCVVNSSRQLAGVFAGDFVAAHRAAAAMGRSVYGTLLPPPADIAVFNAYPKDMELVQVNNALGAVGYNLDRAVTRNGSVVLVAACPRGVGIHLYAGANGRVSRFRSAESDFGHRRLLVFSPALSHMEITSAYPVSTEVFSRWDLLVDRLRTLHGPSATVTVFPCASLQMPA